MDKFVVDVPLAVSGYGHPRPRHCEQNGKIYIFFKCNQKLTSYTHSVDEEVHWNWNEFESMAERRMTTVEALAINEHA